MKGGMENMKICNVTDMDERRDMSSHPSVTCSRCGAVADNPKNVCVPSGGSGETS